MKRKFIISNILMLITPILLIGVISVFFLILFIMFFPADALALTKFVLMDFDGILEYLGGFFTRNPFASVYLAVWLIMYAASVIITLSYITSRLSSGIIPPIASLTEAAEHIKNGDLDFEIIHSTDEEMNRLCTMFDEMRMRLKSSTEQEQLLRHERSMMLANLSHDIKTPVTSIKGYVQGIRDGLADNPEAMERYLDTIEKKAEIIDSMIDSLSMFSKLEMKKIPFSYTVADVYGYVRSIAEEFTMDAQKAGCTLTAELPYTKCYVKMDCEILHRVFANLIDNSIKYRSDNESYIKITASENNSGVLISVADNGIGMADDELDKVFDGFYRIDSSRSKGGSGLGLGISKQIVENHGGKMWFRSGVQCGSEAVIYLPKRELSDNNNGKEF